MLFKDIEVGQVWKIIDSPYAHLSFRYLLILEIRSTKNRINQTCLCVDGIILYANHDLLDMRRDTWFKSEIESNNYFTWERVS